MASQVPPGRKEGCLRVAVVGLSGQSRDGGGVGKSCLCNRFVRPAEDNYSEEHLSTVTSSDFYGPIINSQHFLYWGYTKKGSKSSSSSPELNAAVAAAASALGSKKSYEFEVIEHTLFVDDSTLTAFGTGEGSLAAYIRRVSKTKLSSPGKVAYLNRDHLEDVSVGGTKFKTDPFPTPFEVDAFVVAADVSRQRPDQTKWLEKVFSTIGKLKRPFIVAACKCDIGNPVCMEELETLVKRCAKGTAIVETSAKEGVNVENAFLALASAIRKNGKHVPFHGKVADSYPDASRAMAEERSTLMAQFKLLLEREIHDFQITWSKVEQSLKNREELQLVLASAGRDAVRRVVMAHAKKLKEERRVEQLAVYKSLMLKAMEVLLPGVRNNTRFEDAVDVVTEHTVMSDYFVDLGWPWDSREGLANPPLNDKVPLELLRSVHGREVYENHVQIMQVARQEAEEGKTLRSLLESHRNELVPGASWSSSSNILRSRSGDVNFGDNVRQQVYSQFDADLRKEAREEYRECLLESIEVLESVPPSGLPSSELKRIEQSFKGLPPYERLRKCVNDRSQVLVNLIAEKQRPPLHEDICRLISQLPSAVDLLVRNKQWEFCSKDQTMSTVLIGQETTTAQLVDAVRDSVRKGDLPASQLPRTMVCLTPQQAVKSLLPDSTTVGKPHGFMAAFSNEASFDEMEAALKKLLLADEDAITSSTSSLAAAASAAATQLPYRGIPLVLVQIRDTTMTLDRRKKLKRRIANMLARLQCPLVKVTCPVNHESFSTYAASAVVMLRSAVDRHYSALHSTGKTVARADLKLALCCIADDSFEVAEILSSLFNHQLCWKVPIGGGGSQREAFRVLVCIDSRMKVLHIRLFSSLNTDLVRRNPHHGYIILHSAERVASSHLAHVLALHLPRAVPRLLFGKSNGFDDASEVELDVLAATEQVAHDSKASVLLATPDFQKQVAPLKSFIEAVWDKRDESMTKQGVVLQKTESDKSLMFLNPLGLATDKSMSFDFDEMPSQQDPQKQQGKRKLPASYSLIGALGGKRASSESNLLKSNRSHLVESGPGGRSFTPEPGKLGGDPPRPFRRLSDGPPRSASAEPMVLVTGRSHVYDEVSPGSDDVSLTSSEGRRSPPGSAERPRVRSNPQPDPSGGSVRKFLRSVSPRRFSTPISLENAKDALTPPDPSASSPPSSNEPPIPARQPPRRWSGEKRPPVSPKPRRDSGGSPELPPRNHSTSAARPASLLGIEKDANGHGNGGDPLKFDDQHFSDNRLCPQHVRGASKLQRAPPLSARSPILRQKYLFSPTKDKPLPGEQNFKEPWGSVAVYDNVVISGSESEGRRSNVGSNASSPPRGPTTSQLQLVRSSAHSSDQSLASFHSSSSQMSSNPTRSDYHVYDQVADSKPGFPHTPQRIESRNAQPIKNISRSNAQFPGFPNRPGAEVLSDEEEAPPVPPRGYISDEDDDSRSTDDLLDRLRPETDSNTTSDDEPPPPLPPRRYLFNSDDSDDFEKIPAAGDSAETPAPNVNVRNIIKIHRSRSTMHSELLSKHERKEFLKKRRQRQKEVEKGVREREKREREEQRKLEKQRQKEERARKKKEKANRGAEIKQYRPNGPGPGSTYFGVNLYDLPKREDGSSIPLFVEICLNFIEEHGLDASGIYRVGGKKPLVDQLQADFGKDPTGMTLDPEVVGVTTVASALKSFFRRLPEPLIPTPIISPLSKALNDAEDADHQLKNVKMLINAGVPSIHLAVLKYLCGHLHRIALNHEANLMTSHNLGVVFWPTLMRPESLNIKDFTVAQELPNTLQRLVVLLIEHYPIIFDDSVKMVNGVKESAEDEETDGQRASLKPYMSVSLGLTPITIRKAS